MAENRDDNKEKFNRAENSASSSSAQNSGNNVKKDDFNIQFAETDEALTKGDRLKAAQQTPPGKIDRKKIERIKKELMAEDEQSLEDQNRNVKDLQTSENEEIGYRDKDGNLISRSERIARKNEQLMDNVFRYSRQKTKDLATRKQETVNVVLTVVLFLMLVAVLTMGVYLYLQKVTSYDEDYIRVSVSMTNKDIFYETEVSGDKIPKSVSPGDRYDLNVIAKNSNNIMGDTDSDTWTSIYVRFKISLIINGVEYKDFIYVEPDPEIWERYNKEIEDTYPTSENDRTPVVKEDDGYYYCRLILMPNEQVTVIDKLRFSEKNITEVVGGNDAVLKIQIEALESIPNILKNREIWDKAPQNWVLYMTDENNFPDVTIPETRPDTTVNIWWVVIFISVAIILAIAIVFVVTHKKKDKRKLADLSRTLNRLNQRHDIHGGTISSRGPTQNNNDASNGSDINRRP